jgi:hypothetical protein
VDILGSLTLSNINYSTVNGVAPFSNPVKSETVNLIDNSSNVVNITNSATRGSFTIMVQSVADGGAAATFVASKSSSTIAGSVSRTSSSPGLQDEEVNISYGVGQMVQLYHSTTRTGGTGATLAYTVRTI